LFEGGDILLCSCISEGDADIAEEARAFDALDGRFFEDAAEILCIHGQEIAEGVGNNPLIPVVSSLVK